MSSVAIADVLSEEYRLPQINKPHPYDTRLAIGINFGCPLPPGTIQVSKMPFMTLKPHTWAQVSGGHISVNPHAEKVEPIKPPTIKLYKSTDERCNGCKLLCPSATGYPTEMFTQNAKKLFKFE